MGNFRLLCLITILCFVQSIIEPTLLMLYTLLRSIILKTVATSMSGYFDSVFLYYFFLRIIITLPGLLIFFLVLIAFLKPERLFKMNYILLSYVLVNIVVSVIFLYWDSSFISPAVMLYIVFSSALIGIISLINRVKILSYLN